MTPSSKHDSGTPRRQFIGELALGAASLAAVACAPPSVATGAPTQASAPVAPPATAPEVPLPPQSGMKWDATWMERINAKHKAVFDSPQISYGNALYLANGYLDSVKDVFGAGDSDASVVVVLRHSAVPMLYNDAMWTKYDLAGHTKTQDPKTKAPARRNIFYRRLESEEKPASDSEAGATIESLMKRGVTFVGCDMATRGIAYQIAERSKRELRSVYEDLRQNVVPGATLMTTGIFATLLAQEAGCSFMAVP